jgi:NAD(P)-dependent dehydrogenase (short-subunit alcohol dehydrogenase family)
MPGPLVIVGATGAIGGAIARRAAARGETLHLVARDATRLEAMSGELGGTYAVADALDPVALTAAVQEAGGLVGGLAYCVGSIVIEHLDRATAEHYVDAFRLNAVGAAIAVQAAARGLHASPGSGVVLFSTVAVRTGFPGHTVIAAAKGAVEGLAMSLAAELAPNVRVNCIAPSLTRSGIAASLLRNPAMEKALAGVHPIPRLGEGDDAGAMADFLLSPAAGWITGQVIGVDGGRGHVRNKG